MVIWYRCCLISSSLLYGGNLYSASMALGNSLIRKGYFGKGEFYAKNHVYTYSVDVCLYSAV